MSSTWETVRQVTPDQKRFFENEGYLKFGRIFEKDEIYALRAHVDEMIAALPEGKRPEGMDVPHFSDPWLFKYLVDDHVLDVIEDLIGPDIILWSSHFIAKPGGDGKAVPWHTDGAYWGTRLVPMRVVTLWLAVDESTLENGCMSVIPGSHRQISDNLDRYERVNTADNVFDAQLRSEFLDESRAVSLELAEGECSFHDSWTIHGSLANLSNKRRCGYTMRYMPANVVHTGAGGGLPGSHRIYLVRGQDQTNGQNSYSEIPAY